MADAGPLPAWLVAWLWAFLFTQAVEVPIYRAALGRLGTRRTGPWARTALAFLASAITHPIVWFVIAPLYPGSYWGMAVCAETFAVVFEAIWLWRLSRPRGGLRTAGLLSLLANCTSLGLGLLSRALFGVP